MDFDKRCPICGGVIGYHINSYGRIVEQCSSCKHIIPDDPVITTNNNHPKYKRYINKFHYFLSLLSHSYTFVISSSVSTLKDLSFADIPLNLIDHICPSLVSKELSTYLIIGFLQSKLFDIAFMFQPLFLKIYSSNSAYCLIVILSNLPRYELCKCLLMCN